MTLREDLADWADWDVAAHAYGNALGIFEAATQRQVRRVVLSDNPLGLGLHEGVTALVTAGVLERRDDPEEQYRWIFAGPEALPGAAESTDVDGMPLALELPGLTSTRAPDHSFGTDPTGPEGRDPADGGDDRRPWWRRRG